MKYARQAQTALDKLDIALAKLRTKVKNGQVNEALQFMEQGELKDRFEELQKQQSAAEIKKNEYLKSVELLKKLIQEKGTKSDLTRITAIGYLIETTDFLNIPPDKKKMLKENMIWCNSQYEKYTNEN